MPKNKKGANFTDSIYSEEYGEVILGLCSAGIDSNGKWSVSNNQSATFAKNQLETNELFAMYVSAVPNEMTYGEFMSLRVIF